MKRRLIALFLLAVTQFMIAPVQATDSIEVTQESQVLALSVSPAILEVILDKAKPVSKEVLVRNTTNTPLLIKVLRQSFSPEEKREIPKNLLSKYDASAWIELKEEDADFIIQPKEVKKVTVTIRQPKDASPGGHYASLVFQPLVPEKAVAQDSVYVYGRVVTLLFMQVRGEIVEDITLDKIDINNVYESRPVMKITLTNRGNTHIRPSGNITIRDNKGTVKKVLNFVPSLLLPGMAKEFTVEWKDKDLPIGVFMAQPTIHYGVDKEIKAQEKQFYIIPFVRLLAYVIGGVVALVILNKGRNRLIKAVRVLVKGDTRPTRTRKYQPFIDKRIPRS